MEVPYIKLNQNLSKNSKYTSIHRILLIFLRKIILIVTIKSTKLPRNLFNRSVIQYSSSACDVLLTRRRTWQSDLTVIFHSSETRLRVRTNLQNSNGIPIMRYHQKCLNRRALAATSPAALYFRLHTPNSAGVSAMTLVPFCLLLITIVKIHFTVIRLMTAYSSLVGGYQRYGGTHCLHLHDWKPWICSSKTQLTTRS